MADIGELIGLEKWLDLFSPSLHIDGDVLLLRITIEHAFEGELAAYATLLVTAVRSVCETLVGLDPKGWRRAPGRKSPHGLGASRSPRSGLAGSPCRAGVDPSGPQ